MSTKATRLPKCMRGAPTKMNAKPRPATQGARTAVETDGKGTVRDATETNATVRT